MRHVAPLLLLASTLLAGSVGCRSPYYQDKLALIGAGTGALAGAAIGNASGHSAGGAIIGGIVGATAGGAVGSHMDEVEARNQALIQERLGRSVEGATTYADVIAMSNAGLSDQVITTHIRRHGVAQVPQAQDLIYLKSNGVSDAVIGTLQAPPPTEVVRTVAPPPPRAVIVEEYHYGPHCWGPPPRRHVHHHHPGVSWGVSFSN
ncbi:hypothetical protein DTL21_07245 [Bremerella cremea]|uniref:Glycine zipper domain-containing protein n=1 Tax=Blastopirellula marina TaxID=124 RepID=A0A2S8G0D2_9BACT|nr:MULTISPECIES: glycine zipper domain-containing protein [Pirellulaceae]PQO37731.1 hypothetical protein C5Y83_07245 [Blastopirellula marina]RCS50118.1 hypothetical protein DTL21_07245 [Bremerella cremea]